MTLMMAKPVTNKFRFLIYFCIAISTHLQPVQSFKMQKANFNNWVDPDFPHNVGSIVGHGNDQGDAEFREQM